MKGVILGIAPDVNLVDITHDIHSYDILEAIAVVDSFYRYFPPETIHVVVVDPGVGSSRRPIAAYAKGQYFVAPDNAVLSSVLSSEATQAVPLVYEITNEALFQHTVSHTFHGRDIFAPTAAHLANGTSVESVGGRIVDFAVRALEMPHSNGAHNVRAKVLRIDKFGNIITNLRPEHLRNEFCIRIAGIEVNRRCNSFSEARAGEFFAIDGSAGFVEIAVNQGSAAERLKIGPGAEFDVESGPS
jgi:S-adenosylmethionine hydrolase